MNSGCDFGKQDLFLLKLVKQVSLESRKETSAAVSPEIKNRDDDHPINMNAQFALPYAAQRKLTALGREAFEAV